MLSKTYMHLYFPIDWSKANSRAVAYLVNKPHDALLDRMIELGFKSEVVELKHTRKSGSEFKVIAHTMPKSQWVLFLLTFKNAYQRKIIEQLQAGTPVDKIEIGGSNAK